MISGSSDSGGARPCAAQLRGRPPTAARAARAGTILEDFVRSYGRRVTPRSRSLPLRPGAWLRSYLGPSSTGSAGHVRTWSPQKGRSSRGAPARSPVSSGDGAPGRCDPQRRLLRAISQTTPDLVHANGIKLRSSPCRHARRDRRRLCQHDSARPLARPPVALGFRLVGGVSESAVRVSAPGRRHTNFPPLPR